MGWGAVVAAAVGAAVSGLAFAALVMALKPLDRKIEQWRKRRADTKKDREIEEFARAERAFEDSLRKAEAERQRSENQ